MINVPKISSHHRAHAAAAVLFLVLTLLLCACSKNTTSNSEPSAKTEAPTVTTEAPTEPESSAPVTEAPVETERAPAETAPDPSKWNPSLNRIDISFFGAGESFVLVVEGIPAGTEILWSAEDEAIAAVDDTGRVTAVGPGSARIYAEMGGYKLTCWIRCKFDAPLSEDAPSLDKTDMSFFGVGEFYRLTVNNAPEDGEILWESEDYSVATVDETGRVTAVGPGTIKVKATVGEYTLSCWVRCQFAAPAMPHSSVADGTWTVTLRKDRITALNEAAGIYTADASLLVPIRVAKDYLNGLKPGDDLNLSAFGEGIHRVEALDFSGDRKTCTVTATTREFVFQLDDAGKWTLLDEDGAPIYTKGSTAKLVFDGNTVYLDQMSAVIAGQTKPIVRDSLQALFGEAGFENELPYVNVTVKDGIVTEVLWQYHP